MDDKESRLVFVDHTHGEISVSVKRKLCQVCQVDLQMSNKETIVKSELPV